MGDVHPNAEGVMKGFKAFAEGDVEGMKALFTEDAVWHSGGKNKWTGDYEGIESILGFFGAIAGEAAIENELHAVLADDDHAVALVNSTITRGDESLAAQQIFIFHSNDGIASEAWATAVDQSALDEFWS